jgi:hypothetical protein
VSSITTGENRVFYRFTKRYDHNEATSLTTWCCCGSDMSSTQRTHPSSTDNTLLAQNSTFGTLPAQGSLRSIYRSNSKCCGPEQSTVAQSSRRPKLFGRRGWGRGSKATTKMNASLFDNLSDDELDEDMNRTSKRRRTMPLRRALAWKRK